MDSPRKVIPSFLLVVLCTPVFLIHRLAFRLDDWLFPSLRRVAIKKPLFIVGLPRSGTTLLHRLMASNKDVFTTMPLWELVLAPALCEKFFFRSLRSADRRIGSPLWYVFNAIQNRILRSVHDVHPTTLHSPEEDYLALLPFNGCFLRVIFSPHNEEVWKLGHFSEGLSETRQAELISIYKQIIQRHLYFRGQHLQLLSKNPSFTAWLPGLAEEFPDAHFVGLRRAPEQAVPSQLSSIRDGMMLFGNDVTDEQIVNRFVKLLVHYWRVLEDADETLPADRFQLIEYQSLIEDSFEQVTHVLDQFGYELSQQGLAELQQCCANQRNYKSRHQYSLDEFGLCKKSLTEVFGLASNTLERPAECISST